MLKKRPKRITVKIGTKVLTNNENRIDLKTVANLADQICALMDRGIEVVVVSSGAIASGLGLLGIRKKGRTLSELQAIASIGQNHLMDIYSEHFGKRGYSAGQILLTQEDFNDRKRFLNIRYTIGELFKYKAIPVINENDSVSTEEIKCGDNDRLSSLVAGFAGSSMLILLTDVDGLYGADGEVIKRVSAVTDDIKALSKGKGSLESTGGMTTKLDAAKNASISGLECVIARGKKKDVILDIIDGKETGTFFSACGLALKARKRWIALGLRSRGKVIVDEGAERALTKNNKSLLPSGVVGVRGDFSEGDTVDIVGADGNVVAKGLTNYSSKEIQRIKGMRTDMIKKELGFKDYDEVIHRDNLVLAEAHE